MNHTIETTSNPSARAALNAPSPLPICRPLATLGTCLTLLVGCSHSAAPSAAALNKRPGASSHQKAHKQDAPVQMSAEQGALNPQQTHSSFYNSMDAIQQCVTEGTSRLRVLSGSIEPAVEVDARGRAGRIWAMRSTLGDWETEHCIFEALRAVSWPPSQGGPFSVATNRFEFPLPSGVDTPALWDSGKAIDPLAPLQTDLLQCQAAPGLQPMVTLYIDETGQALAGGISAEHPLAPATAECLLKVVRRGQFPPATATMAKLRFRL